MTANIRLGSISLDCAAPDVLADFWATLLDGEVAFRSDTFVAVNLGPMWLTAITVEDYQPPTWPSGETPKQIHLDLAVKDLAASEREVLKLGATRCEVQPDPSSYLVFVDPAGHPFCLTTQIPD
jgi:hypothetical protein